MLILFLCVLLISAHCDVDIDALSSCRINCILESQSCKKLCGAQPKSERSQCLEICFQRWDRCHAACMSELGLDEDEDEEVNAPLMDFGTDWKPDLSRFSQARGHLPKPKHINHRGSGKRTTISMLKKTKDEAESKTTKETQRLENSIVGEQNIDEIITEALHQSSNEGHHLKEIQDPEDLELAHVKKVVMLPQKAPMKMNMDIDMMSMDMMKKAPSKKNYKAWKQAKSDAMNTMKQKQMRASNILKLMR
eukprot:gnl/Trimastix_PCT/2015.p1 GENE.gnl/Trimastix_PCT/2015~~gnl/Trimastix_PCT/2015.p1  ORF type:complete len:250 (+),score=77.79 gnl/Trimastix_PCT/2015:68-817(+)